MRLGRVVHDAEKDLEYSVALGKCEERLGE